MKYNTIVTKMQMSCRPLFSSFDDRGFLTPSYIFKVLIVTLAVALGWVALLLVLCGFFYGMDIWFFTGKATFVEFMRVIAEGSVTSDFAIFIGPTLMNALILSYKAKPLNVRLLPFYVACYRWLMLYACLVCLTFMLLFLKSEGFHLTYTWSQLVVRSVLSVLVSLLVWIVFIYRERKKYVKGAITAVA